MPSTRISEAGHIHQQSMTRDVYRDARRGRLLAMQPRRARSRRTVVASVALVLISQGLIVLFLRAAL